jgi:SAM-dependent methyltransferase
VNVSETKARAITVHSQQAQQFAQRYAELPREPYKSCFSYSRHRLELALAQLLPGHGQGRRLLDVGCGTGHHLASFRQRGFEVAGVDGSEEMTSLARINNPGVPITRGDVEELPFPSGEFDVVLCIEVLRYLPRLSPSLREIARVLCPGGVCLATAVPPWNLNGYWVVNRVASVCGLPGFTALKQSFHTSDRLRWEFEAAGFALPQVHGIYCGPINWVERLAPKSLSWTLRHWERVDSLLANRRIFRELSNMLLIHAIRASGG